MRRAFHGLSLVILCSLDLGAQLLSPGELARDHAELEGLSNCTQCHKLGEKVPDKKCLDCHENLAKRIRADKGYHATLTQKCIECHSDHKGRDFQLIRWEPEKFDHNLTGYPLEEAHSKLACKDCHTTKSFLGLSQDCLTCHEDQHQGQLSPTCLDCHTLKDWQPVKFDHEQAAFQLRGKHTQVECVECHQEGLYKNIAFQECRDCHQDQHQGQFSTDCTSCHTVEGWLPSLFNHETARFRLRGQHTQVACSQCHPAGLYRPLDFQNCNACHQDNHQPTLGLDCQRCHTVSDWTDASDSFNHQTTRFPLEGAHQRVECKECHQENQFSGLNFSQCQDCHQDYHRGQFVEDCSSCHSVDLWKPTLFDHERSRFKLRGKHQNVECAQCHDQGVFKPLNTDCIACHTDPHQSQFAVACSHCHTVEEWAFINFDHNQAAFKLEGAHQAVECGKCHKLETNDESGPFRRFKPLAMECQDCHQ